MNAPVERALHSRLSQGGRDTAGLAKPAPSECGASAKSMPTRTLVFANFWQELAIAVLSLFKGLHETRGHYLRRAALSCPRTAGMTRSRAFAGGNGEPLWRFRPQDTSIAQNPVFVHALFNAAVSWLRGGLRGCIHVRCAALHESKQPRPRAGAGARRKRGQAAGTRAPDAQRRNREQGIRDRGTGKRVAGAGKGIRPNRRRFPGLRRGGLPPTRRSCPRLSRPNGISKFQGSPHPHARNHRSRNDGHAEGLRSRLWVDFRSAAR